MIANTVEELIDALSKFPKDKRVYTNDIGENLKGELYLTHKYTQEELDGIEQMKRNYEEEMERAEREAPRGVW